MHFFPVPDREQTRRERIDAVLSNRFCFNGETYSLAEPLDWGVNPSADLEWHVLLHKFYYAVGLGMAYAAGGGRRYRDRWVALTDSWIARAPDDFCANPALRPEASQVAGRRVQNWIYAYYYFVAAAADGGGAVAVDFQRRFLVSLHDQVEYLCGHLSAARNHRTLELAAIFLAAVTFPEFRAATDWLNLARAGIVDNINADLLGDGVHCEQSTDYHHLVTKNYLNVRRLAAGNAVELPAEFDRGLVKALEFSLYVHKPDGVVPALSDGDACDYRDLLLQGAELYGREDMRYVATGGAQGRPPAARSRGFADGGYYVLRSGWGEDERFHDERYLIVDCGPLGQGNHGHFDGLSFELAGYGRSLIVDPGRYTYDEQGDTNWRARFRGSAYHNTVLVDGKDQVRYGPVAGKRRFKVQGAAYRAVCRRFVSEPGLDFFHGALYSQEYDAVHQRRIFFIAGDYWVVADTLHGKTAHDFDLLFHLSEHAQDAVTVRTEHGTRVVCSPQLLVAQCATPPLALHVETGFVAYRYGEKQPAPVLRFRQRATEALFFTVLYPYRDQAPRLTIEPLAENAAAGRAFRVTVDRRGGRFVDNVWFADSDYRSGSGTAVAGSYQLRRQDAHGAVIADYGDGEPSAVEFAPADVFAGAAPP